jgi:aerobic-type carbon monoxide dehydrogenase small subunit (CoxS/CutS family)
MRLNGSPVTVDAEPSEPLAFTLRDRLGLTGTKISCDVQACGACTVLVDGLPRSACTFLAWEARDRDVLTVEGLAAADDALHPLQEAFLAENGFQCGFCTPGMLLAAHAWLNADRPVAAEPDGAAPGGAGDADAEDELLEYMSGNLCRCTGYLPIAAAILRAARGRAPGG